jgi:4-amino-4-deoxy-L-arabinose transferase-like glycosyltransferase
VSSEVPVQPSESQAPNLTGTVLALSGLLLSAGTIHLVATVQHLDVTWTLPLFFAVVGALQLYGAWALYRRPRDRRLLSAAAAGSLVVGLLWLVSRTIGLSFGPEQGVSAIGVSDTIASLQEVALAAIALAIVRAPEPTERRLAWLATPMGLRWTFMVLSATLFTAAIGGHRH